MPLRNYRRISLGIVCAILLVAPAFSFAAPIRVTTWNLEWFPNGTPKEAPPAEQQTRIHAAADVLRALNSDIILLQEVRDYAAVQQLIDAIKPGSYHIAICSAFKDSFQKGLGKQQVVILAREPAQAAWAEPWKSMQGVDPPRGFAFAWLKVKGTDVGVYCVHLKSNLVMHGDKAAEGAKNVRKREVASGQLLDHIRTVVAEKMPSVRSFIIGGDFNTNIDEFGAETTLTQLQQDGFQNALGDLARNMRVTHPGSHGYPDATFDYLLAKNGKILKPTITKSQASDHLPVTCEVELGVTGAVTKANAAPPKEAVAPPAEAAPAPDAPAKADATNESVVTLTQPVTIKIPYGQTVLPAGTRLQVVSRDAKTVDVRYLEAIYPIPLPSTDLK